MGCGYQVDDNEDPNMVWCCRFAAPQQMLRSNCGWCDWHGPTFEKEVKE